MEYKTFISAMKESTATIAKRPKSKRYQSKKKTIWQRKSIENVRNLKGSLMIEKLQEVWNTVLEKEASETCDIINSKSVDKLPGI